MVSERDGYLEHSDAHRLTSPKPKMILTPYKTDAHS
jgi:hypothetical protein